MVLPFELRIAGASTSWTFIEPVALRTFETAAASSSEILRMTLDLFSPVPAADAPAFCTKNISSVGGYLRIEYVRPVGFVQMDDSR